MKIRNKVPPQPPASLIQRLLGLWKDTWWLLAFIYLKFFIFDFRVKVPTGSMEPTLHGHPDYGDNVCVNHLAYASVLSTVTVIAGFILIVGGGLALSGFWRRNRLRVSLPLTLLVIGTLAWTCRSGFADEPKRFQIVTFDHESVWDDSTKPNVTMSYVKRLVGLPGEQMTVSGGDLYRLNPATQKNEIVRKWQTGLELQSSLWMTVAKSWPEILHPQISDVDRARIELPWDFSGATLKTCALELDGRPAMLKYKYPVTNIFAKQGRWPFVHVNCPLPPDPDMTAYVLNTCDGIQCPRCKRVMFPLALSTSGDPLLKPQIDDGKNFGGGESIVGDLKLDLGVELTRAGGTIEIELGSTLHRAVWTIPSSLTAESESVHPVLTRTEALSAGPHRLTLAYVDATVIASLDGREIERRCIEIEPPGAAAKRVESIVRVSFDGVQGKVVQLDLSRDLYYAAATKSFLADPNREISERQHAKRYYENGDFVFEISNDMFLMLGDNSPSSSDGRVWGFVPRQNLTGRALGITWPPSRWQVLK